MTDETLFVIESMDIAETRRVMIACADWFHSYLAVVDSTSARKLLDRVRSEKSRLASLEVLAGVGPIEVLRREHPRRYDAIDNVYWGCMNAECNGDTALHQRIWADRP